MKSPVTSGSTSSASRLSPATAACPADGSGGSGCSTAADLDRALGTTSPPDLAGIDLSARNQLRGRILALTVEGVMAEVTVAVGRPAGGLRDHPRVRRAPGPAGRRRGAGGHQVHRDHDREGVVAMKRLCSMLLLLLTAVAGARRADERGATRRSPLRGGLADRRVRELAKLMEQDSAPTRVRYNFAGSQQLAVQLEQGARPTSSPPRTSGGWTMYGSGTSRPARRGSSPTTGWS